MSIHLKNPLFISTTAQRDNEKEKLFHLYSPYSKNFLYVHNTKRSAYNYNTKDWYITGRVNLISCAVGLR